MGDGPAARAVAFPAAFPRAYLTFHRRERTRDALSRDLLAEAFARLPTEARQELVDGLARPCDAATHETTTTGETPPHV